MTDAQRDYYIRRLRFPVELERAFQEDYYQRIRYTMRIAYVTHVTQPSFSAG